jgi:hypothetical protein
VTPNQLRSSAAIYYYLDVYVFRLLSLHVTDLPLGLSYENQSTLERPVMIFACRRLLFSCTCGFFLCMNILVFVFKCDHVTSLSYFERTENVNVVLSIEIFSSSSSLGIMGCR